jgi:hypothetical protein
MLKSNKEAVYSDYHELAEDINDAFPNLEDTPEMLRSIAATFRDYFGYCPPFEIVGGRVMLMQADLP